MAGRYRLARGEHALKQIRRFSELERPARGLFLQASVLLPLISINVQWFGFRKTKALLQHFLPVLYGSQNPDTEERAALTARMVRVAWHYGIRQPNCLKVSLLQWWLLARRGIASDLRVGVRKDEKSLRHMLGSSAREQP
jgi:hypothetical protein